MFHLACTWWNPKLSVRDHGFGLLISRALVLFKVHSKSPSLASLWEHTAYTIGNNNPAWAAERGARWDLAGHVQS